VRSSQRGTPPRRLEFKPADSSGVLLTQHVDALEQETQDKGGVQQVLADYFAKVFRIA
jgi:hypothetical protein